MRHDIFTGVLATISALGLCTGVCWSDNMKLIPSNPLAKVLRSYSADASSGGQVVLDGARGETISAQTVLISGDKSDAVTASLSDLKHANGRSVIPAGAAHLQWVRYMDISANTPGIPEDELVGKAPLSIPDPFWEDAERAVEAKSVQPLWIELDVPSDSQPGEYTGELTVKGREGKCSLPVKVRVRDFRMPEQRHQNVIQWWDFPGRGFESLKPGTDGYWKHLEQSCAMLVRHRQTDVRVEWGLISPKTTGDGWDTTMFERFADIAFKAGLRAVQFTAVGQHTKNQLQPDSRTVSVEVNMGKLAALQEVVVRRGWQGRVFTSLADEPFIYHEKTYQALLESVRKVAPNVGVVEAIESEDLGDLDIYVPKLSHINLWWPHFEELKRKGEEVWFYTCCHPVGRYPNRFLDQPLVTARELHWIGYLYGLDGYLHWGFNWFAPNEDPYTEKGATQWGLPPGDGQVAYPGKNGFVGSLRLSTMRDGLQDYEYLWTLENRLRALRSKLGDDAKWLDPRQRPLELCRRVVQSFYDHTRDPKALLDTRTAIADEIEQLAEIPLLYVQTSPPDGTVTPAAPIMINIHGVTTPGAKVKINGVPVIPENISGAGCFIGPVFLTPAAQEIVVTAELDGKTRMVKRTFRVVE